MKKTPFKTKHRIINMLAFACMFIFVPFIFTSFVEHFAPTSYFVDVQELEVGDMQKGVWSQQVSLTREVKTPLFGTSFQELRLYKIEEAPTEFFYQTEMSQKPILFERADDRNNTVSFVRHWDEKVEKINPVTGERELVQRVPDSVLNELKVGETYQWTWVIEFQTRKNRTDIVEIQSNPFTILAPAEITTVEVETAETVIIEE